MKIIYRVMSAVAALLWLIVVSCGGGSDIGCHGDTANEVAADTAYAEPMSPEELEKARLDSLESRVLTADSLKEKHILVDKESSMLYVREDGATLMSAPVCLGRGIGQKRGKGDHKTPEGEYKIRSIEKASGWTYDFHDGRGKVKGAYGPWFFRLNTPQSTHIGIHGTLFPESMGKRESDGCVRMRNDDLEKLRDYVAVGMKVIINPDKIN